MALIFAESLDNATGMSGYQARGWTDTNYTSYGSSKGRLGGNGIYNASIDGTGSAFYRTVSLSGTVRCAFWFKSTFPHASTHYYIARFGNSGVTEFGGITLRAATGYVGAHGWGTGAQAALGTGVVTIADGGWHYVEAECLFANSGGVLKVWVDGTLDITVSGDTLDSGTVAMQRFQVNLPLGGSGPNHETAIDDILIWDDAGSDFTGNLGGKALIMKALRPTSDAAVQFTRSTGLTNYSLVDDVALATSDYVESGTVGQIDRYGVADTGLTTETVKAVIVEAAAANPGAGAINLKLLTEQAGTTIRSGALAVPGGTTFFQHPFLTKPAGGAWAMSDIDAATFGIEVA